MRPITYIRFEGVPLCSNQDNYERWRDASRTCNSTTLIAGFCSDCSRKFQVAMIEQDRCEHPEVRFREDEDGWVEGYIPKKGAVNE